MPPRETFAYTFARLAEVIERFTEVIGLTRFAIYIFDYGAPSGIRRAVRHPERITAIISQNGNAYEEGLSDGWNPIRAYWQAPSEANSAALRTFLSPETTIWQYTHGVPDPSLVSPDGYSLDNFYLARPGADEAQLDLFGDYKTNVAMYPEFQAYFRKHRPPFLAAWGKNDPFFLPPGGNPRTSKKVVRDITKKLESAEANATMAPGRTVPAGPTSLRCCVQGDLRQ
jgi:pimeloyl-ACP methyl ester carboxylesterase